MTDETTTTPPTEPQNQPGPNRTADGTIIDASKTTSTPPPSSTTTDSSSQDQTKPGDKTGATAKPGDKTAPATAPEKYEAFTVPDGFKLDEKVATEAGAIFKELNLPQAAAQRLVDFYVKETQAAQEAPYKVFADMQDTWKTQLAEKYGAKLEPGGEHAIAVSRLLSHLGPLEKPFREAMDNTGSGNHPDLVAGYIKLASLLGEGTDVRGNGPSPLGQSKTGENERVSAASAIYPHLPSGGR